MLSAIAPTPAATSSCSGSHEQPVIASPRFVQTIFLVMFFAKLGLLPHALAAGLADETMLHVGQPDIIGPAIAADRDAVATAIVGLDQDAAHAHVADLGEAELGPPIRPR
jgi:hypothetical protein